MAKTKITGSEDREVQFASLLSRYKDLNEPPKVEPVGPEDILPTPSIQLNSLCGDDRGIRRGSIVHFYGPKGSLKALDVSTLIPTPNGFKRMGDLEKGDYVYGTKGQPVLVTGTSPIYYENKCYELIFSNGDTIVADGGHLWVTESLKDRDNNRKNNPPKQNYKSVKTTEEIFESVRYGNASNHRIDMPSGIEGNYVDLPLPPYYVGVWLGDGTSANSNISSADVEIIDNIKAEGLNIRNAECSDKYRYVVSEGRSQAERNESVTAKLRKMNMLNNKHIPEQYLWASYQQRMDLFHGLMDTDGTCPKDKGIARFDNTNKILVKQTRQLAASLGFQVTQIRSHIASCIYKGLPRFSVAYHFEVSSPQNSLIPFKISRKIANMKTKQKGSWNHIYIKSVIKAETRPVKCITVQAEDNCYLAGKSFIPTHNTTIALEMIREAQKKWPDKIAAFLDSEYRVDLALAESCQNINMEIFDTGVPRFIYRRPESAEDIWDMVRNFALSKQFSIIVVDSLAANRAKSELENDKIAIGQVGLGARINSACLKAIAPLIAESGTILWLINQERIIQIQPIVMKGPAGGNAPGFYSTHEFKAQRIQRELNERETEINITSEKMKWALGFKKVSIPVTLGKGINVEADVIEFAVLKGVVGKSAAYYTYGGSNLGHGLEKSTLALRNNPELLTKISNEALAA